MADELAPETIVPPTDDLTHRLEDAMAAEVMKCTEEGISTCEENSVAIRERMLAAHDRVLAEFEAEQAALRAGVAPLV